MPEQTPTERGANYRKTKAAAGKRQLSIWLDEALHREIKGLISQGVFRDRSELVTEAVKKLSKQERAT